jgi:hypothetical protein
LVYLFEARTGKMTRQISTLGGTTHSLAFSQDGRYLTAGLAERGGLRVYDRDRQWTEAFRDTDYSNIIYGVTFAADDRLATTSEDGKIRLYDANFKLVVPPMQATGGKQPIKKAFSPDGTTLAVGYEDVPAPLPRPNVDGLNSGYLGQVAFSRDGKTLYAGGIFGNDPARLLAWANAGRGGRRVLPAGTNTIGALAALPDDGLMVTTQDPHVEVLEADGLPRWVHPAPNADMRDQYQTLAVSADGTIVDFGFEQSGKSPVCFDVRALKLSRIPLADHQTIPAKQDGLAVQGFRNGLSPTLDGKPIKLAQNETARSLSVHPDGNRFGFGVVSLSSMRHVVGPRVSAQDRPVVAYPEHTSSDRTPLARMLPSVIGWIGSLKRVAVMP